MGRPLAKIQLAGTLAKPAAGAAAVWLLAQPGDDQAITEAFNDWRTVNLKLLHLRTREWDNEVKAVQAAWPEGEDRKAFDRFMSIVFQEADDGPEQARRPSGGAVQARAADQPMWGATRASRPGSAG